MLQYLAEKSLLTVSNEALIVFLVMTLPLWWPLVELWNKYASSR